MLCLGDAKILIEHALIYEYIGLLKKIHER